MYAALIHEGDTVRLPSGRLGIVEAYEAGAAEGSYLDNGEPWALRPKFLKHVSSRLSASAPLS